MLAESDATDSSDSGQQLLVTSACVAWRGDGNYVATLVETDAAVDAVGGTAGHTAMRVWDGKTLQLHAEGEATAALSAPAAWQPNGRHLYAVQHAGSTPRVVLFERNGLQHGGFDIPVPGAPCAESGHAEHAACEINEGSCRGEEPSTIRTSSCLMPQAASLAFAGVRTPSCWR